MRAEPLEIKEVPTPTPGAGQLLVRIEASGLCHTDIHAARGDGPARPTPPFLPGHEGVGIVELVGPGVTEHTTGDRVAIPWLGHACGTCDYCVTGWETPCEAQQNTGCSVDGGHAAFALADARYVVRVPEGIDPAEVAPLTCAGVTTYRAVKVGGVSPGDRVAIFGIGGLGHLAQQYAQIFGGETIAIDVTEEKLALAKRLGAAHVVNAATTDPVAAIEALGGADVAVVLAASPRIIEQAHASLRRGGRLILVSSPKGSTMALPIFQTVLKGIRADFAEVFRLHAAGRTRVMVEPRALDDINSAMEDVLAAGVPAHLLLLP
ncbi:zinc-dependent alcohol dehydrogenase [Actinoplanes sp. NPDC049681]|uniref:zinc-dependent alcohol dehydrogenase n=1 Tax=Actinoplanes sp. NPDC049681 TaxID=3363905 RepID=UPI0037BA25F8